MYTIENGNVKKTTHFSDGSFIEQIIGAVNKTETVRKDENNVEDISYTFDLQQEKYVEQSRSNREDKEKKPKNIENEIEQLKAKQAEIILALTLNDIL